MPSAPQPSPLDRLRGGLRAALQVALCRSVALVAVLGLALAGLAAPAQASSAGRYLTSDSYQELASALKTTSDPARLADLEVLEQAVAGSSDRAQLTNTASHSVGVFARYKKLPATEPASFYVLGPGHTTDDDFELVGLYVPAEVSLDWGTNGVSAGRAPRVARILEGQQLTVSDPVLEVSGSEATSATTAPATIAPGPTASVAQAPGSPSADVVSYALSLPVFAVTARAEGLSDLPVLTQSQLDLEPETAPLD